MLTGTCQQTSAGCNHANILCGTLGSHRTIPVSVCQGSLAASIPEAFRTLGSPINLTTHCSPGAVVSSPLQLLYHDNARKISCVCCCFSSVGSFPRTHILGPIRPPKPNVVKPRKVGLHKIMLSICTTCALGTIASFWISLLPSNSPLRSNYRQTLRQQFIVVLIILYLSYCMHTQRKHYMCINEGITNE